MEILYTFIFRVRLDCSGVRVERVGVRLDHFKVRVKQFGVRLGINSLKMFY